MEPAQLLALCVLLEAGGESDEGKAAVCRVILNREKLHYESDGTVVGTVLRYDQFSWAWFAFVNGKYTRISDTPEQAMSIAEYKLKTAPKAALDHCEMICAQVEADTFHGPLYDKITDDVVLYVAPKLEKQMPVWATPDKLVCVIGNQNYYRA